MYQSVPQITLNDGLDLPVVGFGTWSLNGNEGAFAMKSAIDVGYRLIDTAYNYENEGAVGEAIRRSSVSRGDLRITSKLPGRYQEYDKAITAIQESLYRTNLDYFDLYLIHWPLPNQDKYTEAWQALIDAKKWGYIRSIGVCNFLPEHIDKLREESGVIPSINQVELHPTFNQAAQRKYHEEHHITTQSWSPLARASTILQDKSIENIANAHGKSVSQIILRWHYQLGAVSIPKSSSRQRQIENLSVFDFELNDSEMKIINSLTREDGRTKNQDPAFYEEF